MLPSGGPESNVFPSTDDTFFASVNDVRVVKYAGSDTGFVNFSFASPLRTPQFCDGTTDPQKGNICGRALGLAHDYTRKKLVIADAYQGLREVGPEGGLATLLSNSAGGRRYKWLDGLDVDQTTGKIYFTDASATYNLSQSLQSISTGDATGRFIEFDPNTGIARVLVSTGLQVPGGVGTSLDGSFVLYSEFGGNKITKYYLTGPKANTRELLLNIPGPTNIKRLPSGNYWVAVNNRSSGTNVPTGVKIDKFGKILLTIPFVVPYSGATNFITEVHEHRGKLYIASIYQLQGVIYTLPDKLSEALD
ncbi:hypothetical protein ACH5RR_025252 [Cinchona calisaya]|uniref:Strictosidine synthase conserved region domain-containing protein n=1 Tax=Cinchona calisaya TaxID=153742 RepID=A0ABD2Z2G1_9GENT